MSQCLKRRGPCFDQFVVPEGKWVSCEGDSTRLCQLSCWTSSRLCFLRPRHTRGMYTCVCAHRPNLSIYVTRCILHTLLVTLKHRHTRIHSHHTCNNMPDQHLVCFVVMQPKGLQALLPAGAAASIHISSLVTGKLLAKIGAPPTTDEDTCDVQQRLVAQQPQGGTRESTAVLDARQALTGGHWINGDCADCRALLSQSPCLIWLQAGWFCDCAGVMWCIAWRSATLAYTQLNELSLFSPP